MSSGYLPTTEPVAAFASIARALSGSLDLAEVLRRIANEARVLTEATGVSIVLRKGEIAEFMAHASPPPGSLIPVGFQFQPNEAIVRALQNRTAPLVIQDLHASPLIPDAVKDLIFVRDLVIVPLRADGGFIGVLNLAFNEMPVPPPWDPVLLVAMADQAAVAVRNAQLYEDARSTNDQLVHAEKLSALGRLVAHATHELNNPLTTARLLTESLDVEPLPYAAMELVQALSRELDHASVIVRDLLLFVHRGPGTAVEVKIPELIHDTIAELDRRLSATGTEVVIDLAGPLPTIRVDPHGMRQVLSNLVQNGIQALAGLDIERCIQIRAWAEGDESEPVLVIEVEDNGLGIPATVIENLFNPFYTTKPMGEGTGLGLTIIKGIVEQYGGSIEALNAPAGGALFRVRLPAMPESATAEPEPLQAASLVSPTPPVPPADRTSAPDQPDTMHVLVIDDEPELQRALRRVLTHLGCNVTTALDGETAIRHAREHDFDLVLCDVRIPGLHGPELLDRMRLQTPRAAEVLVFMTGDTITREIREFIASTGRPSLTKPFGRAQLQELLGNVRAERG
jgi:signal transduction histidine kinase